MNILLISNLYPAYKGHTVREISYALHNFAKEWIKNNNVIVIRPYFVPSKKREKYEKHFVLDGVCIYNLPVYRIPKTHVYYYKNVEKTLKELKFNPDKIVAHLSSSFIWGYKLAKKFEADFIAGIHNSDLKNINYKKYDKVFKNSYKIACRSESIKRLLLDKFPFLTNKVFVANSGIPKNEIESKQFFINKIASWKHKREVRFLTVALLQKLKNIDINIEALSKLRKYPWRYTIVGDGEERAYLEKLVKKNKLENRIDFVGMKSRKEALEYMKKSDVFLMISAPETFGLAFLEAMSKGNIIVGAKGWGIDGIVKNGVNGYLVEPRNLIELVSALQIFFKNNNYETINKIITESYYTINNFIQERMAEEYIKNIEGK